MRRSFARRAVSAAPGCQAALVRQETDIAGIRRRIAIAMVTGVITVRPVLAGAFGSGRRRPENGGGELTRRVHRAFLGRDRRSGRAIGWAGGLDSTPRGKTDPQDALLRTHKASLVNLGFHDEVY